MLYNVCVRAIFMLIFSRLMQVHPAAHTDIDIDIDMNKDIDMDIDMETRQCHRG